LTLHEKNTTPPILLVPKPMYQNPGERRKTKGKQEKGVLWLWKIERVEPLFFFFHWGRHQLMNMSLRSMEPQIDNVDLDALGLFTSRTDKACLGGMLNSKCFIGEAEELLKSFCHQPLKHQHNITTHLTMTVCSILVLM